MVIHFSILGVILFVNLLWESGTKKIKQKRGFYIMPWLPFAIIFGYLAFLAAMRSGMNDTSAYVHSFDLATGTFNEMGNIITDNSKDKAFYILANLFKMFISDDYHLWFAFFSIIESLCFIYILRRETVSILDSCFFFFTSTLYYNYFSMMRQWFALALFFLAFKWLKRKQFLPYLVVCLLAAQFHNSAYLCIPVYFLVHDQPFCRKQLIYIFILCILMFLLNPILSVLESSDTTYNYVFETMTQSSGSSPIRILISAVPIVLCFVYRNKVYKENNNTLNICINMSMINLLLNIMASFTSGLYLIRMSTYFNMFNVLLFPFILERLLVGNNRKIIKIAFYVLYFLFYIYQMNYQGAFGYSSDVLGKF